jgi:putative flavoprotein involved in K+ transport
MSDVLDVVVIGAGWAGLGISHGLRRSGISHVVLERGRIGETWRSQRWDSFRFNIPRVLTVMPGDRYDGSDPEGAMTRDEFVSMLEDYVSRNGLPVHLGESVTEVTPDGPGCYRVKTETRTLTARNVVVASGSLNRPKRPAVSQQIPPSVRQIDTSDYRSATALEAGAVLVVGAAQSGGQIAKDISDAGRQVYFATSKIGRLPRSYRGRHLALWMVESGALEVRRKDFVLPSGEIPARPLQGAVETLSLQLLSAQGVVLLGKLAGADGTLLTFTGDVAENIRFADENSAAVRKRIDDHIARNGIAAPPATDDPAEVVAPKLPSPPITSLDLEASGISTIVWCTGFDGDFSWLRVPGALGADGQPSHVDSIGAASGVYFAGLDFASTRKSGTILASADESRAIVGHILGRLGQGTSDD